MVEVIKQETGQTLSISQGEIILVTASSAVSQNVVTVALDTQFSCLHFLLLCIDKPMEWYILNHLFNFVSKNVQSSIKINLKTSNKYSNKEFFFKIYIKMN